MRLVIVAQVVALVALVGCGGNEGNAPIITPVIASFGATPASAIAGTPTSVTFSWTFAESPTPVPKCTIDQGVGALSSGGTATVTLLADTVFTLTCASSAGSDTATTVVTVTALPVAHSLPPSPSLRWR
jgi:hypothetical protein